MSSSRWRCLLRARVDRFRGNLWLDGVIASLAVAALGAAVVFDKVISTTGGSPLVVATNLAYPLADLLLLALAVATFALRDGASTAPGHSSRRASPCSRSPTRLPVPDRSRQLRGGWAARRRLAGCSRADRVLGLAAVAEARRGPDGELAGADAADVLRRLGLGLLVYDHFDRINGVALVLATATIAAVIGHGVLSFRDGSGCLPRAAKRRSPIR